MKDLFSVLLLTVALLFGLVAQAQVVDKGKGNDQEVKGPYNCDDPKCQQEEARRGGDIETMEGEPVLPGIRCKTDACLKDAHDAMGFNEPPLITPPREKESSPRANPTDVDQ